MSLRGRSTRQSKREILRFALNDIIIYIFLFKNTSNGHRLVSSIKLSLYFGNPQGDNLKIKMLSQIESKSIAVYYLYSKYLFLYQIVQNSLRLYAQNFLLKSHQQHDGQMIMISTSYFLLRFRLRFLSQ